MKVHELIDTLSRLEELRTWAKTQLERREICFRSMDSAPKGGPNILVLTKTYLYRENRRGGREGWVEKQPKVVEAYWFEDQWEEWCGEYGVTCTRIFDPVAWCPMPPAMVKEEGE